MKRFIALTSITCWAFFASALSTQVQSKTPNITKIRSNPVKGTGELTTDYKTKTTTVRFYNRQNQLIYEEAMPGRYVKLTKRNVYEINQAFDRMVDNQLVLATVRPSPWTEKQTPLRTCTSKRKKWGFGKQSGGRSNDGLRPYFQRNQAPLRFRMLFVNPAGGKARAIRIGKRESLRRKHCQRLELQSGI